MQDLDHKHIIVTAALANPPRTVSEVEAWMRRVVEAVDMQILFGPHVTRCDTPGNEGVTGIVCIETSHASIHVWDTLDVPFLKFDLYSCKRFDPTVVTAMIKEFDPYYIRSMMLDRNKEIKVVAVENEQVANIIDMLPDDLKQAYLESQRTSTAEKTAAQRRARSAYNALLSKFSIGAIAREARAKADHKITLTQIKARAQKKNLDFDLDPEWYAEQVDVAQQKWPKLAVHSSEDAFWGADVERRNPTLGYTKDNCRIIPRALNVAKWKWSASEVATLSGLLQDEISGRQ